MMGLSKIIIMNKASKPHFASSLTLYDWLDEPDARPNQNWLLTYIDVFVLIVMLVVTLIALSSFEQSTPAKTYQKASPQTKATASRQTLKPLLKKSSQGSEKALPAEKTRVSEALLKKDLKISPVAANAKQVKLIKATRQKLEQTVEQVLPAIEHKLMPEKIIKPVPKKPDAQRARQYLQKKLNTLGLQDKIHMTVEKGYAQLEIQDNILYQSSAADLSDSGKAVLTRLTPLLQQSEGLIYIEGHTDNRPIKTSRFPSNWELGAARATSVLHFLAEQQIDPGRMRAVTFADTQPIADNNTAEGRQKNRRVNIVIKVPEQD
jgi:chemotaxis protein MotB